jgi:hypothetical protein
MATEPLITAGSGPLVVVCDRDGPAAEALRGYLQAHGLTDARWLGPRDIDEAEAVLRCDDAARVVMPGLDTLVVALWSDRVDVAVWRAAHARVTFLADSAAVEFLPLLLDSWHAWRQRRRRARAVAGFILSLLAIAAAFAVLAV